MTTDNKTQNYVNVIINLVNKNPELIDNPYIKFILNTINEE